MGNLFAIWSNPAEEQLRLERERYEELLARHRILQLEVNSGNKKKLGSKISIDLLKEYIQTEILATSANSKYVPDPIESKVYLSVYQTFLETLLQLSNTTKIDLVNHELTFQITPIEK